MVRVMSITALRPTLVVLALGMLISAAPAAAQTAAQAPQHRLVAAGHGVRVTANLFTYCRTVTDAQGVGTGMCADGVPTPTTRRLPAHRGGNVMLTTGAAVSSVEARYAGANGSASRTGLRIERLDESNRRFNVALPASRPLAILLVSIRYRDLASAGDKRESGDAHFSVGLREHRHALGRPLAVTTRTEASCDVAPDGTQSCRLSEEGRILRPRRSTADCRGGRMLIRLLAGGRGVLRATVPTTAGCRYRLRDQAFSLPAGIDEATVETRFLGSSRLAARNAATVRIDLSP
jgi:hypothetical protein